MTVDRLNLVTSRVDIYLPARSRRRNACDDRSVGRIAYEYSP